MEPIHIFYKELPVDENNTFTADITEKNKVESVKFKKSQEYAVIGLSINQYIGSALVTVTDIDWQNFLSNSIQKLVKEIQKQKIYHFKKKSAAECPPIKLTFYNIKTKKNDQIEFYNYFQHLQKFGYV